MLIDTLLLPRILARWLPPVAAADNDFIVMEIRLPSAVVQSYLPEINIVH